MFYHFLRSRVICKIRFILLIFKDVTVLIIMFTLNLCPCMDPFIMTAEYVLLLYGLIGSILVLILN